MRAFPLIRWTALVAVAAMLFIPSMTQAQETPGGTYAAWVKHRNAVAQDSAAARYYTFTGIPSAADAVPNLAGDKSGPMAFHLEPEPGAAADAFKMVPGRWAQTQAVRLDQGYFAAPAPALTGKAFTATLWFRKLGQGAHRGNDRSTTGMLLAMGNGYYEGWRVTTAYPSRRIGFEIGRPQGAIRCETEAVADGVWHHLAVTWDGRTMRVYLDGEPAASAAYDGPYTPPGGPGQFSQGEFRVGFAGSGIGSVVMDVDEAALYQRALSPEEVLQDAYFYAPFTKNQMAQWTAADSDADRGEYGAAKRELTALLASGGLHPDAAALVRLHLCDLDRRDGESVAAASQIQKVLDTPQVAARLHRQAMEKLLAVLGESAGAALPRSLYDRLLGQPEITPDERLALRLNLGHSLVAAKNYAGARAEYRKIAEAPDAPAAWRTLARLCAARTFVRAGQYAPAKAAFVQIKAHPGAAHNSMAARATAREADEALSEIARLQLGQPAADPQAGRVRLAKRSRAGADAVCRSERLATRTTAHRAKPFCDFGTGAGTPFAS